MHTVVTHAMRLLFVVALVFGLLPATAALAQDKPADIATTAINNPDFSTLVAALQAAGLVDALKADGPYTVFAPTNAAFAKLPPGTVDTLLADPKGALTQILLYHVVPGKVLSSDLSDGLEAKTLQGESVKFKLADGKAAVNDANIVAADIAASNGVIHVIDSVILPPSLAAGAAQAATPAATAAATPEATAAAAAAPSSDIVDTAVAAGDFKTLVAAVQAAGLVDALKADGPFTVFAPTDAAFAKLPAGTVDKLLADPKGDLTQILLYHLVPGKVLAADVKDGLEAATLQGGKLKFSVQDGKVKVNDANVVATDILGSNGVIHVIDSVLLPPPAGAEAAAATTPEAAASNAGSQGAAATTSADAAAADKAPQQMPVTGGEQTPLLALVVAAVTILALGGLAVVTRRT